MAADAGTTLTPATVFRSDYKAPVFHIDSVEMGFDLDAEKTIVATRMQLRRAAPGALVLDGEDLKLKFVAVDGKKLAESEYALDAHALTLPNLPDTCTLDIAVRIRPIENKSLAGLYASNGNLFTQCEAQGFRKITYFPDRPDVMTRFTVMLRADRKQYPVLLSNGNLIEQGKLSDGRHYAKWEDPFLKPSYLFALVAGKLKSIETRITSASGAEKLLQVYVEKRDLDKVDHTMQALIHSIRWDEKRFGLELDLDRFMIVAVGDFNMGAMENKGLNIFNTMYALATPDTATDLDFANIEAVVGHEYFHNWTGNRVTCRDWFQLTLKEGLTVFRDQEFSADMAAGYLEDRPEDGATATARSVLRIESVRDLRARQFSEDAGPMAHPVRPESYQAIDNFYTATVYEKGSEIVRMQQTLLGRDGFRAGMDEYFRRHDGQAVTCDDFVAAMESVYVQKNPGKDLSVFRRWYAQAGTPRVSATGAYDAELQTYTLSLVQNCPKVGIERQMETEKLPFHIPFAVGLLDAVTGKDMPLALAGEEPGTEGTRVLDFTEASQQFVFTGMMSEPVPSLLRNFSAPVNVDYGYSDAQLALLSSHDSDAFNRWEAGQRLAQRELVRLTQVFADAAAPVPTLNPALISVYQATLNDASLAPALKDLALTLPGESVIAEQLEIYDPQAVRAARDFARHTLALALREDWLAAYQNSQTPGDYSPDPESAGKRGLKNCALNYLTTLDSAAYHKLAWKQFEKASNMTDRIAALTALINSHAQPEAKDKRAAALEVFYKTYKKEALVMDKWLRAQSTARCVSRPVLDVVSELLQHKAFVLTNPNKVYSLLGAFFNGNAAEFHRADGAGYTFWAEQVLALNQFNPTLAGRMARALDRWKRLPAAQQAAARAALETVQASPGLSKDVVEIVGKALAA